MTEPYWEPLAAAPPPAPVAYGTSLPASPVDGQEAILVDSLTAPTYQWRMRYNAAHTTAFKWEFVGGLPVLVVDNSGANRQNTATSTWQWITGMPFFNLPRAGEYRYRWGGKILTSNPSDTMYISVGTVATPPVGVMNPNALYSRDNATGTANVSVVAASDDRVMTQSRVAGSVGMVIYSANTPANMAASSLWMEVQPMAVA